MPSLRETLQGHVRAGHSLVVVLPGYHLFDDIPKPIVATTDEGYEVRVAPCRWMPAVLAARRLARRMGHSQELPYPLRWSLNLTVCVLLTASFLLQALKLRYREKMQFQLVYAHNQYASLAGWLVGRWLRVPNVTRLYGTFLADLMRRPLVGLRYPVAAAGFLVPHSLLICANDGTRGDEVAQKLGVADSRFRFWTNGVDMPSRGLASTREELAARFPSVQLPASRIWVLSCSRLTYWKRIDRILRALQVALAAGSDCQLLLAGSGPDETKLHAQAEQLGIESHVSWLGAVEHGLVWDLMHAADVFMIANDVTNRCNPLYEAIGSGLPIVSVRDPSTADLLEHGGNALLADKDDTELLGRLLHRVCSDAGLAASLRKAQAERKKLLWSWQERMAEEVHELERLVAERNGGPATGG